MKRLIGPHIISGYRGPLGKPRCVVLHACDAAYYHQVRAEVGPQCYIIMRWQCEPRWETPETSAQDWYGSHIAIMRRCAHPRTLFQGANEVPCDLAAPYRLFEAERLRLLHGAGLAAGVGAWGVGHPSETAWVLYRALLGQMALGDAVIMHSYWADQAGIANTWHTARWAHLPGMENVPIVVGECGRDVVEGKGKPGWRKTCNAEEFIEDLRIYGRMLTGYSNVLGAAVFTAGPDKRWKDFAVDAIWPRVVAEYEEELPPAPPPPTPPPPQTLEQRVADLERRMAEIEARDGEL